MANMGNQLPQVTSGGSLMMTVHQVNGDGAGPYSCQMNADGTAQTWTDVQVDTNVPGRNSRSQAKATDFPLKVQMPANMACTGNVAGQANTCVVRCMNAARAGVSNFAAVDQLSSANMTFFSPSVAALPSNRPTVPETVLPLLTSPPTSAPSTTSSTMRRTRNRRLVRFAWNYDAGLSAFQFSFK
jgi:hypothetical protein